MKVGDFLSARRRPVITIGPDETVYAAIQKLVANNIGALPVCDNKGVMSGIISERDILRLCVQRADKLHDAKVKDVMTRKVVVGVSDDELDYVMNIMTGEGIRHLPIMEGPKLVSIISARDVIEVRLEECRIDVRYLSDYISGGYV